MNLYKIRFDLRKQGRDALVCGWGTATTDVEKNRSIQNAEYSEDLHCLSLLFGNRSDCNKLGIRGDFQNELLCAKSPKGITTLVIKIINYCFLINL